MLNIFKNSYSVMSSFPEVDVLLATHNGAKFLDQFLISLAKQVEVQINLIVSDDCSTDQSTEICKKHALNFKSFKLIDGPNLGSTHNFLHLLKFSESKYIFFADQDDVWKPNRIALAVSEMGTSDKPILHVTRAVILGTSTVLPEPYSFPMALFRNRTQGNCISFNKEFKNKIEFSHFIPMHHDWYFYLVGLMTNSIVSSGAIQVNYRIHKSNQIGLPSNFFKLKRFLRDLISAQSRRRITAQVQEICRMKHLDIDKEKLNFALKVCESLKGNIWSRIALVFSIALKCKTLSTIPIAALIIRGSYSQEQAQDYPQNL